MDKKLIATKQSYEIHYISYRYNIPKADVLRAIKEVGISRKKVYAKLREYGYQIIIKSK